MTKEKLWQPIFAHLGEMPELNNHIEEYEDLPEEYDYKFEIEFLKSKIIQLYIKLDPMNFERNWKNFKEELETTMRNHKNEKPNTSDI